MNGYSNYKTVTHGLMSRVFLMKWYHFSVEYFEDLRNVHHCEFLIMKKEDSGKYILENQLRTWSDLKREREAEQKEQKEKEGRVEQVSEDTGSSVQLKKQWGGCPNGCSHSKSYFQKERPVQTLQPGGRRLHAQHPRNLSEGENDAQEPTGSNHNTQKNLDIVVSSPDGAPLCISMASRPSRIDSPSHISFLRAGRDFGGSASGNSSIAGSETEASSEDDGENTAIPKEKSHSRSGMGRGAKANALGDQSDVESDCGRDCADLEGQEPRGGNIKDNVY